MNHPQVNVVFRNWSRKGSQTLDLLSVTIGFPMATTFLSSSENRELAEQYHTAMFFGNKILRSMMVHVTPTRGHAEIAAANWGKLERDEGGQAAEVLGPLFAGTRVTYLRSPSRRPARIGALMGSGGRFYLFSFHVYRGALKTELLAEELAHSLSITVRR